MLLWCSKLAWKSEVSIKASNYNFFYEKDNGYLAYNSRSNALAVITKSDYDKYDKYVKFGKQIEDEQLVRSV